MNYLQAALDHERNVYNAEFPSPASDCQGRLPLIAHPELLHSRREYQPSYELALFDLQRVLDYLAAITFDRKINTANQVRIGGQMHYFSKAIVRDWQTHHLLIRSDPIQDQWVFSIKEGDSEQVVARRPTNSLDVKSITGFDPQEAGHSRPFQIPFAFMPG
ncbi:hypothetical protein A2W24_01375 [Microgenomates group bacterium RBG_16_45_19]|nr:MAG: hypothetical protein A2W24_01375 [Microgenomates group bacterium RBG_16_45_19]